MHVARGTHLAVFLGLSVCGAGLSHAATLTMERHMEIQTSVESDPGLGDLPSVKIDTVLATVPVDDRLNADLAFSGQFVDELRSGIHWYLGQRGLRVAQSNEDLRMVGTIIDYEGNKGYGDWGVEIEFEVKIFRDQELLLTEQLSSRFSYSDDDDVVDDAASLYAATEHKVSFIEVLFTRVGIDLGEKLIVLLKEKRPILESRSPSAQDLSAADVGGMISIDASVDHAEILVDGDLVGTTPVTDLLLSPGEHSLEVRKAGFMAWKRVIKILPGATSRFFAELEPESS